MAGNDKEKRKIDERREMEVCVSIRAKSTVKVSKPWPESYTILTISEVGKISVEGR